MNKNILSAIIVTSGILISGAVIGFANAETINPGAQIDQPSQPQGEQGLSNIQFPIKELGSCKNKEDCKTFCDNSKNADACFAFAGQHNLMSPDEVAVAKKFQDNGMVGPGGCKGQAECDQYCGNSVHLEECIVFAQKNGLLSPQQEQDSKKVLTAVKNGIKPPACAGPKQCDAYCGSAEHMEECMNFSLAAGLVPDNQKDQMQKTLKAIKQGIKPPACRGPQECDQYCSDPAHMEECMNFSLAAGLVPEGDKAQVQKTFDAIKNGIKPPACQSNPPNEQGQQRGGGPNEGKGFNPGSGQNGNGTGQGNQSGRSNQSIQGRQSCDQYCADSSHVEECVKFSVAIGNMTEQQAQAAIKTGGKGPGGCVGRDACDTFCSNPDNQETCFNFGKENGMIPEGDLQKMEEGQQRMKDSFNQIPPEVLACITETAGADVVEKMKTGSVIQRKDGDPINQCFQKFSIQERRPNQNQNQSRESGQFNPGQQDQSRQPEQNQIENDLTCSPKGTAASFVCAKNGRNASGGPETTYFNSCTAKQDGAEIIHDGVCEGQKPCGDVADPVCGNDGHTWVSACYAKESGGGVKYEGVCKNPSGQQMQQQNQQGQQRGGGPNEGKGFNPGSGQNGNGPGRGQQPGQSNQGQQMPQQAGPGGCKGPEECQKYCTSNPEVCKNFQPQQNQQGQFRQSGEGGDRGTGGPGIGGGGSTGPCGTGPGTCSGQGPDDRNFNKDNGGRNDGRGQWNQPGQQGQFNQPGQMMSPQNQNGGFNQGPQQGMQPPQGQQPQQQPNQMMPQEGGQNLPPPPSIQPSSPSSFLEQTQTLLGGVFNAFIKNK